MRFGSKHEFHLLDLIGDAVKTTWEGRHAIDWTIIARRMVKLAILTLTIVAMIYVLYPTQKRGWLLWLGAESERLAHWTAVSLVGFTAVVIPGLRYAWEHSHKILAWIGGFFAVALLSTVLMGTWNYYAFASSRAVSVSLAASSGAGSRIQEAERRLGRIDLASAAADRRFDTELARTPASYATARSRILNAQTEARRAAASERASIQTELAAARAQNVQVNTTVADPRPIDQFISSAFGTERTGTGIALDLWRSLVFELAALIGVALSTTAVGAHAQRVVYERAPLDDSRAIEDLRAKPRVQAQKYAGMRERVYDAETGDELVTVPGYLRRKTKRRGGPQPAEIEAPPISLPDETGVQLERDSRVARSAEDIPALSIHPEGETNSDPRAYDSHNDNSDQLEQFDHDKPSLFGEPSAEVSAPVGDANDIAQPPAPDKIAEHIADHAADYAQAQQLQEFHNDLTDDELAALAAEEEMELERA